MLISQTTFEKSRIEHFSLRIPFLVGKKIVFEKYNVDFEISEGLKKYYSLVPKTISRELISWVEIHKPTKTNEEYLNHILIF